MKRINQNRIVITGIGVISPNGIGKEKFWQAIESGRSGIKPITSFSTKGFKTKLAAEITGFNAKTFLDKRSQDFTRSGKLLCSAVKMALEDAKITIDDKNTDDIGICTATTLSSIKSLEKFHKDMAKHGPLFVSPMIFPTILLNSASSLAAIYFGIRGFNTTISTGFTAGLDAIEYAVNLIKSNRAKIVLAAAVEEISPPVIKGKDLFCPFGKKGRDIILGEGAAVLVIEKEEHARNRKAGIYAKIKGIGNLVGALKKSMAEAVKDAGTNIEDINYISTSANPTKSIIGETFSASGLFEVISAIGMIKNDFIATTVGRKPRKKNIKTALINNTSCQGRNICVVISKYP